MPNRLDLPPELASLIEKREQEDRRAETNTSETPTDKEKRSPPDRRKNQNSRDNESP